MIELRPEQLPARVIDMSLVDPAGVSPGVPPNLGEQFLPQITTVVGRSGYAASAYSNYSDEALYQSWQNAEIMRQEVAIMECLEARMRATALLNWHVTPMDSSEMSGEEKDEIEERFRRTYKRKVNRWEAEDLARKVTQVLSHTPNFMMLRYNLMNALWYGRHLVQCLYGSKQIGDRYLPYIRAWEPRHGDKLVFRYDDGSLSHIQGQVGIRVGWMSQDIRTEYTDKMGGKHDSIEATEHGLVFWLNSLQRATCVVHRHIIEDGDFNMPWKAGSIHGIGIRTRIYWTWWAYQECMRLLLEYLERSALGIEIWRYPAHNKEAETRAKAAAAGRSTPGRKVILFPVPAGDQSDLYNVEIVEPGLGGLGELQNVLESFFQHKIKRYILGQTLSSEAGSTGMGSGVAEAHLATLADIVRFDAINLEESMTFDLLPTIQKAGFARSENVFLRFQVDTESSDASRKMEAYQAAFAMGAEIRAQDIYKTIGASPPGPNDKVLKMPDPVAGALMP